MLTFTTVHRLWHQDRDGVTAPNSLNLMLKCNANEHVIIQMFPSDRKLHGTFVQPRCAPCTAKTKWKTPSTAQTSPKTVFWRWVAHAHVVHSIHWNYTHNVLAVQLLSFFSDRHDEETLSPCINKYLTFSENKTFLDSKAMSSLMIAPCGPGQPQITLVLEKQEWQRNLKQNHCFAGSGPDPSCVIVQENSWSVVWTNASLLNISLWLTELPFSPDWNSSKERACAETFEVSDSFNSSAVTINVP